jgi:hypothetical protein
MNEHWVVIYVNKRTKTFTATARKKSARLAQVDAWARTNGFTTRVVLASNIARAQANATKKREIASYKGHGYAYIGRPPL